MPLIRDGFHKLTGEARAKKVDISSITVAVGDLLIPDRSNAVHVLATSAATCDDLQGAGVALEAATTSDTQVLICYIDGNQEWQARSANNSNSSHNNMRAALSDEDQVNNTGSDVTGNTGVFEQTGTIGAASDTTIKGRFVMAKGIGSS